MILDGGGQASEQRFAPTPNLTFCWNQGARKEPIVRFSCLSKPLAAFAIAVCSAGGIASAQTSDYEVRRFDDGPGWLVFDDDIDIALQVLKPDNPQCHEISEAVLLLDTPAALGDTERIEAAALAAMSRYAALCETLGGTPASYLRVSGLIVGVGEPDTRGRVLGAAKVVDARVSSMSGDYQVNLRRIAKVDELRTTPERTVGENAERPETTPDFAAALQDSMANAVPIGRLGRLTGGDRASLTGAWSGSRAECNTERLILFERDGAGTSEWWRASNDDVGLLPWRSGIWELRDGTLIMTFDHKVELSRLTGRLLSGPINETIQFDLKGVNGSELRLAATGGGFSPEALFLGGAEKLFVRCTT